MRGISIIIYTGLLLTLCINLPGCIPGGIVKEGGRHLHSDIVPAATRTGGVPYYILCPDLDEMDRRANLSAEELSNLAPAVKQIPMQEYEGNCKLTGQSSAFFLFHMWPVTDPLDPGYAMGTIVQKLEGDTMINITTWHEAHYYSILGHAVVFKARGEVIRFYTGKQLKAFERKQRLKRYRQRRRRRKP